MSVWMSQFCYTDQTVKWHETVDEKMLCPLWHTVGTQAFTDDCSPWHPAHSHHPPLMGRLVNVYWMYSLIFIKYLWRYVAWIVCLNLVREFVNQFSLPDSLRTIITLIRIIFCNIFNALLSVVKMGESRVLILPKYGIYCSGDSISLKGENWKLLTNCW